MEGHSSVCAIRFVCRRGPHSRIYIGPKVTVGQDGRLLIAAERSRAVLQLFTLSRLICRLWFVRINERPSASLPQRTISKWHITILERHFFNLISMKRMLIRSGRRVSFYRMNYSRLSL